jgi:hypothetical protein
MTDRDLTGLLERASADLPEVDFAGDAWADAYAAQTHRRRRLTTGVGAVAAVALGVGAVQVLGDTGGADRAPTPAVTATTPPVTGTLADGTAYAELPLEGKESELPWLDVGLPRVIDWASSMVDLSGRRGEQPSPVAVFLVLENGVYRPVLVAPTGALTRVDTLSLEPARDDGGNEMMPLGTRGASGRWIAFAQPDSVVLLDTFTGEVRRHPVPSKRVTDVAWTASGSELIARDAKGRDWSLNPWKPGAKAVEESETTPTGVSRLWVNSDTRSIGVAWYDLVTGKPAGQRTIGAPIHELWREPVGSATWVASGAFFDQNLTSGVIRRGNGPVYQGLVAVQPDQGKAKLLLAPESPDGDTGRIKGCCTPLAWWNASTVLLQTTGAHGSWVLAWNVDTGVVSKVTRIAYDPKTDAAAPQLALGIGWRY